MTRCRPGCRNPGRSRPWATRSGERGWPAPAMLRWLGSRGCAVSVVWPAYTLTFAVLLLTGASLGERYGRRRLFVIGLGLFTVGSAAAALAPGIGAPATARAVQGVGAAILIPLTFTLLSAAVPPARRGLALGAWGAVGGLAIAIGPLVGGAVVEGASWQWIFWLNVPIGIALLPIAR